MAKVALFGGAFDPIHHGHLAVAKHALLTLGLDQVRFIPCADPVHKAHCQASPWQRAAMIALAINGQAGFVLDTCELERSEPSYAIDTIEQFLQVYDSASAVPQLYWLLGTDALMSFTTWHRWSDILALVDIVAVNRPGQAEIAFNTQAAFIQQHLQARGHDLHRLTMIPHFQASSQIRKRFNGELDVPLLVKHYIDATGLY